MYSTRTATVTETYADTLTERGRGVSGSTCTCTATVTVTYMDTLREGGRGERGCHSLPYPPLSEYPPKSQ